MLGMVLLLAVPGCPSSNAAAQPADFVHIMNPVRFLLVDELIEVAAEGGGRELLMAVGAFLVLDSSALLLLARLLRLVVRI